MGFGNRKKYFYLKKLSPHEKTLIYPRLPIMAELRTSLVAQTVKHLPAMQEMRV